MKKLLTVIAITGALVACDNNANEGTTQTDASTVDTATLMADTTIAPVGIDTTQIGADTTTVQ